MSVKRTSITVPAQLYEDAQPLMALRYCSNFSEYVADLIKQDVREHKKQKAGLVATTLAEGTHDYGTEARATQRASAKAKSA